MLKLMGILFLFCGSTAVGISLGKEMDMRIREIQELQRILGMLEGEIGYAKGTLAECFFHIAKRSREPFQKFLSHMASHMEEAKGETFARIFQEHMEEDLNQSALTESDQKELLRFGEQLGYLDVSRQMEAIALYRRYLAEACSQAQGEYQQKAKLYRWLGMMAGMFLTVILL